MKLKTQLVLEQARIKDMKIELSDEEPRVTLTVRASLTHEVSECFGCRDLIYAGDVPRSGVDKMALDGEEIDVEVKLENDNFAFQATANSIGHYVAKFEGTGPKLEFRVKFTGYAGIITDVAEKVKTDPLTVTLKPAQMPLDLQEEKDAPEASDDSERLISPEQAADTAAENDGPALASVVEMGGSHQKDNPKKHGRRRSQAEPAPPEEKSDFMDEMEVPEVVN